MFWKWILELNSAKSVVVLISLKKNTTHTQLIKIDKVIGPKFNSGAHILAIIKKIQNILYPIFNWNCLIPLVNRINTLKIYVVQIIIYASAAWVLYIKLSHLKSIETIQKKAIWFKTGLPKYVRIVVLLKFFNTKPLKKNIRNQLRFTFFKTLFSEHQHITNLRRSVPESLKPSPLPTPFAWSS